MKYIFHGWWFTMLFLHSYRTFSLSLVGKSVHNNRPIGRFRRRRPSVRRWHAASTTTPTSQNEETTTSQMRIFGGGLAGLSVAYHVLRSASEELATNYQITIFDVEPGPGTGGASAVAGGLLHPLSPRGKLVHWGLQGLAVTNAMVDAAVAASANLDADDATTIRLRRELFRVATSPQHVQQLQATAALYSHLCEWQEPDTNARNIRGGFGALRMFNGCCVLHVHSYLQGLYAACQKEAARQKGCSIRWQQIASPPPLYKDDATPVDDGNWDVTVYCYGSHMFERRRSETEASSLGLSRVIPWNGGAANATLPIQLVRGQALELKLSQPLEQALLCGKYISPVPHHPDRAVIGATHEFSEEPLSPSGVVRELKERTVDFAPFCWEDDSAAARRPMEGVLEEDWMGGSNVIRMTCGYRVQSARGKYGRRPIIGQLNVGDTNYGHSSWIFTGLSSRGLLYHGLYGQLLAQAIRQKDESVLLTQCPDILWWKNHHENKK